MRPDYLLNAQRALSPVLTRPYSLSGPLGLRLRNYTYTPPRNLSTLSAPWSWLIGLYILSGFLLNMLLRCFFSSFLSTSMTVLVVHRARRPGSSARISVQDQDGWVFTDVCLCARARSGQFCSVGGPCKTLLITKTRITIIQTALGGPVQAILLPFPRAFFSVAPSYLLLLSLLPFIIRLSFLVLHIITMYATLSVRQLYASMAKTHSQVLEFSSLTSSAILLFSNVWYIWSFIFHYRLGTARGFKSRGVRTYFVVLDRD